LVKPLFKFEFPQNSNMNQAESGINAEFISYCDLK